MATKKRNPDTSDAAYHSLDPVRISKTHAKILEALKVLGRSNYEKIADHLQMEPSKIWKRTSELIKDNLIYRTESKVLTSSLRFSYEYAIVDQTGAKPAPARKERVMKGKTVSDFSKELVNKPKYTPLTLF